MLKSTEAEFAYYRLLNQAKGTVRRCARNAWVNGLKQGHTGRVLTNTVRGEICEIIVEDYFEVAYLHRGSQPIQELLDALEQELNELATLQN